MALISVRYFSCICIFPLFQKNKKTLKKIKNFDLLIIFYCLYIIRYFRNVLEEFMTGLMMIESKEARFSRYLELIPCIKRTAPLYREFKVGIGIKKLENRIYFIFVLWVPFSSVSNLFPGTVPV